MTDIPARQTKAILEAVDRYHIRTNPAPEAVFSFAIGTLTIWCTTEDNPGGLWQQARMHQGQLTKPASGLAYCSLLRREHEENLAGVSLQTNAYDLVNARLIPDAEKENRPEDIAWAKRKLEWLWQQALPGEPMPKIVIESRFNTTREDFTDFF
ncbi:MAG TPA: hypothetical protein VGJ87_03140 [Roseiflexaceae bacterium]|jgi:hypothetical protein